MNAVIDAGGGLRNIYTAGVFDRCIDDDIYFDLCIGVSAGSANLSTFLAKQRNRTYRFYHDYSQRKEYMSLGNFIRKGSYLDLDYIYAVLTNSDGEDPIDYPRIARYEGEFLIAATDALTGQAHYFTKKDLSQDNYRVFSASSAIPVVCKPVTINGREYVDGGVAVPVPLEKALEKAAEVIEEHYYSDDALVEFLAAEFDGEQILFSTLTADSAQTVTDAADRILNAINALNIKPADTTELEKLRSDLVFIKDYEEVLVVTYTDGELGEEYVEKYPSDKDAIREYEFLVNR